MSDVGAPKASEQVTLLEHVTLLQAAHPDGPLPEGGRPYPDAAQRARLPHSDEPFAVRQRRLIEVVTSIYEAEPSPERAGAMLVAALTSQRAEPRLAGWLAQEVASFDPGWRRRVGRELAYDGGERGMVGVGLALLSGVASPEDTAPVRLLGLLSRDFGQLAIRVLRHVPGAGGDLVWLAERSDPTRHAQAVEALCDLAEPVTHAWLLREGVRLDGPSTAAARRVAETVGLADLLDGEEIPPDVVEQAGRLLLAMTQRGAGSAELRDYTDAASALVRFSRAAARMNATLDRYAMIMALLADLHTGQAATLAWPDRELALVRTALDRLLDQSAWADCLADAARSGNPDTYRRACWATQLRTTLRQTPPVTPSSNDFRARIAIRVSVPDPAHRGTVETRILVNGRHLCAEAFTAGPAEQPENLLGPDHPLHADVEPHEVRLAQTDCTEGCCGALFVTIERRGDEVIWRSWRNPDCPGLDLPTLHFDAAEYDAEVARAEADHSWEWPARTVARLVRARLREQPDLLARWDCAAGWVAAGPPDTSRVEVSYFHPARPRGGDDLWLQFVAVIDLPANDPEDMRDEIVRRITDSDPRRPQWLAGGSAEAAQAYGFDWPPRRS